MTAASVAATQQSPGWDGDHGEERDTETWGRQNHRQKLTRLCPVEPECRAAASRAAQLSPSAPARPSDAWSTFSSSPNRSVTGAGGISSGVGAAGAGVGQAVLRGLLGAGLTLGQGRAGVPALGGPAAAAEQLPFDVPEALPVVKPGGEESPGRRAAGTPRPRALLPGPDRGERRGAGALTPAAPRPRSGGC